ncbi:MAG: agmatine deiminase family protein [Saprospiraceae bacterium]|nr:agmatine deiminase family protein [Saprospiraceae bacterium]
MLNNFTPRELGYFFPAEFAPQAATWLSWPHKEESWPGKLTSIHHPYSEFILQIADHQKVCINVSGPQMEQFAREVILSSTYAHSRADIGSLMQNIFFYHHPTNDAWCRDHGPAFLKHRENGDLVIVDWDYNAWGNKYPPYDLDDIIPSLIGKALDLPVFHPGIIMEGGSVDFNGMGTLLTTTACLLNPNRNPGCSKAQIESLLVEYYGVDHILWLEEGIVGDDTDGHIDDIVRFVREDAVVSVVEHDASDDNFHLLRDNLKLLRKMELADGRRLEVIELPMPKPVIYEDQRLPASYANFYISSQKVIVPTFRDEKNDVLALETLQDCFPDRKVVGIDSVDIIWGLGSFHCLSQQQPA